MNKPIQTHYQIAAKFAAEKHANQQVKGSRANYMLHLSNVAMEIMLAHQQEPNFDLAIAIKVALLHDSIEDTDTTYEEIELNFGKSIADAVLALTKDNNVDKEKQMADSLQRIKNCSKEAKLVKIADRIANLLPPPKNWDREKIKNYHLQAKLIYDELKGEHSFLDNRLKTKIEKYQDFYIGTTISPEMQVVECHTGNDAEKAELLNKMIDDYCALRKEGELDSELDNKIMLLNMQYNLYNPNHFSR